MPSFDKPKDYPQIRFDINVPGRAPHADRLRIFLGLSLPLCCSYFCAPFFCCIDDQIGKYIIKCKIYIRLFSETIATFLWDFRHQSWLTKNLHRVVCWLSETPPTPAVTRRVWGQESIQAFDKEANWKRFVFKFPDGLFWLTMSS